jgi:uncharacterized protein (TIGR02145 family)
MKAKALIYELLILFMLTVSFTACKKDEINEEPSDPNAGTVQDVDGNSYNTVKIGDQWWMAENLNTSKFRNGENIPNVAESGEWSITENAAYCNSNNDPDIAADYGRLYNWHAVADGRKICPEGWHESNNDNWATLVEFLGGSDVAGGKLKQAGTDFWNSPNTDASNESGFTALPGGVRNANTGNFAGIGSTGNWWSASQQNLDNGYVWGLTSMNGAIVNYPLDKNAGLSVRCVKD